MPRTTPAGILAALLEASEAGALTDLAAFTPEEIAPRLRPFLAQNLSGRQLSQSLWYAKKKGLLATQRQGEGLAVVLTYKGREKLLRNRRLSLAITTPKEWDGKWRMVAFDIPEKRRYARDTFRLALKRIGFMKLESSLWIYPFECKNELDIIADALLLKPHIRHYLVESFDGESVFREHFGLPQITSQ